VVTTARVVDGMELEPETPELDEEVDVWALLLGVDTAPGDGAGCGDVSPGGFGGLSGLGPACACCAARTMAAATQTAKTVPRRMAGLKLTTRVSPLLSS
jgi:hypothetical protein